MRIIAGEWRGRRLAAPAGAVRPTADRVREAWMSIVYPWLVEASVVDLCAGSGALGLEALSRGARHATFVESNDRVLATLRRNIETLGAESRSTVVATDAMRFANRLKAVDFDIAFADPPYAGDLADRLAARWAERPFSRIFGVEHASRTTLATPGDTRRYGDTAITFYHIADDAE